MTGIWVRVERAGRWVNVEFDQLTDAELGHFCARKIGSLPADEAAIEGWNWAKAMARWIREHVQEAEPPAAPDGRDHG